MREIKFRALDDEKTMIYSDDLYEFFYGIDDGQLDGDTIMQFTGLLDKEGNEIYENDLVEDEHEEEHEIVWNKDFACFCLSNASYIGLGSDEYLKIIGNKYEGSHGLDEKHE